MRPGPEFQTARWGLDKGRGRIRVPPVEFLSGKNERLVRDAVVKGIKAWDGKPFPLIIDSGDYTYRIWDMRVVWTWAISSNAAGQAPLAGKSTASACIWTPTAWPLPSSRPHHQAWMTPCMNSSNR